MAVYGHHTAGLCDPDTGGEDLVYSQVWRVMAGAEENAFLEQEISTGRSIKDVCNRVLRQRTQHRLHRHLLVRQLLKY